MSVKGGREKQRGVVKSRLSEMEGFGSVKLGLGAGGGACLS